MRRAIRALSLAIATVVGGAAGPAHAQTQSVVNAIGLIDYWSKPTFKVGDWARYRMSGGSELGMSDNYTLTILIAGEEDFWGDPGFWVETWVDVPGEVSRTRAGLVSYAIFKDTLAVQRLLLYTRKMIDMVNDDGVPVVNINRPASSTLRTRREVQNPVTWSRESLGRDSLTVGPRTYHVEKVLMKQGQAVTQTVGDSTVLSELREDRTFWFTNDVPITHLVREDIETSMSRKAWLIGRSGDAAPLTVRDRGAGSATLLEFGRGGLEPRMVPAKFRKSLAAQRAAERAAATASTRRR
jgi:hypothetical protein